MMDVESLQQNASAFGRDFDEITNGCMQRTKYSVAFCKSIAFKVAYLLYTKR